MSGLNAPRACCRKSSRNDSSGVWGFLAAAARASDAPFDALRGAGTRPNRSGGPLRVMRREQPAVSAATASTVAIVQPAVPALSAAEGSEVEPPA
ncbi:MAG: hypothetical protein A3J28_10790 [Acidobacteria bacterium RIFCSPLOWO2_12_FULL_60_22]|nr:MAG: hypothetical protein A3J28_10790 [Acidobacteria bacterium RIFCSPLOWO2_12_FULL_60_22]